MSQRAGWSQILSKQQLFSVRPDDLSSANVLRFVLRAKQLHSFDEAGSVSGTRCAACFVPHSWHSCEAGDTFSDRPPKCIFVEVLVQVQDDQPATAATLLLAPPLLLLVFLTDPRQQAGIFMAPAAGNRFLVRHNSPGSCRGYRRHRWWY